MTCTRMPNGIVCTNPFGRLHVGNRYIWVDYHPHCGPAFYTDWRMNNIYDPEPNDPVWDALGVWLKKREAKK